MTDWTPQDMDSIVRTVAGEADGESALGQQAVASVIANRAAQSGASPSAVVSAPGQFEGYNRGRQFGPGSPTYERVLKNISPVLMGQAPDPTNGATYFYAPKAQAALGRAPPAWANGPGLAIGAHRFYGGNYMGDSVVKPGMSLDDDEAMPSLAEIRAMAYKSPGQQATPAPVAPSSSDDQLPSVADIYKMAGVNRQAIAAGQNGQAASALDQAAQQSTDETRRANPALTSMFHAVPFADIIQPELTGALAAGRSAIDNVTHGRPIVGASGTPDNPFDVYSATRKANANANAKFYKDHPALGLVAAGGQIAGGLSAGGMLAPISEGVSGALGGGTLANIAGQAAAGATASGALSGYAANQRGETLADQAKAAGEGALFGGAAGAAAEAAVPFLRYIPTTAGKVAVGTLAGGALGEVFGQPLLGAVAGGGAGLGADGVTLPGGRARQENEAYADLKPEDVAKMEAAPQGATAAEAIGPTKAAKYVEAGASESPATAQAVSSGMASADRNAADVTSDRIASIVGDDPAVAGRRADLEQRGMATEPGGSQTLAEQDAAAKEPPSVIGRINNSIERTTGVNPGSAANDMQARVKAGQAQVAPKYEALADASPVESADLNELQKYPIVRKAVQQAKDVLGPEAVTNVTETTPGTPPYKSGTPLTPEQRQAAAQGDMSWVKGTPAKTTTREVLTAKGWQKAEQIFNAGPRDANGAPIKDPSVRSQYVELSKRLSPALDDAIPGRAEVNQEAKETYLKPRSNFQKGEALHASGKTAESIESLEARAAKMTPQERADTGAGYLAGQNRILVERGPSVLKDLAESDFHNRVRTALFGDDANAAIRQTLRSEAAFQRAKPPQGRDEAYAEARDAGLHSLDRGKASESAEELDARLASSSAEQLRGNRLGLFQRLYEGLKDGSLDAREIATNPKFRHVLQSTLGKQKADAVAKELIAHADRKDARDAVKRTIGDVASNADKDHLIAEGVVIHGGGHGTSGTLHGLAAGLSAKLAKKAAGKGFTTPSGRKAIAEAMAKPAEEIAARARAAQAKRQVEKARMASYRRGALAGLGGATSQMVGALGQPDQ